MPDISNNTSTSGSLNLNAYVTSTIGSNGDQDWFQIHLNEGQQVRFDLEGSPTSRGTLRDTYLRGIYNSSGSLISGTRNDDGGTGYNSRVTFTASSTGDYYVAAGAYGSRTGTYRLTATALNTITPSPIVPINPTPNPIVSPTGDIANNTSTSGRLSLDSYVTSTIGSSGDQDWFQIHLNEGQQVRFDLEGSPTDRGTLRDTYLRGIYNNSGSMISGTRNDDGGTGYNSRVTFTASSTGDYYVVAGAYGSRTGTYRLTATALNTPIPHDPPRIVPPAPVEPDLVINNFSLSNTNIRPGDSVSVSYSVNNIGNGSTGASFSTAFYLSTDSTITSSDTLLTADDISVLNAGSTVDRNYNLSLPNSLGLSAGTYYIGAIADYNNSISESNESNNTSNTVRITIPEIRPDLTIDSFSLSNNTIRQGDSVSVSYSVNNRGNGSTGSGFSNAFYLSTDNNITTDDIRLGVDNMSALNFGVTTDRIYNLALPNNLNLSSGIYYIGAIADYNNTNDESNDSNNTFNAIQITINANHLPEINVSNNRHPSILVYNFAK